MIYLLNLVNISFFIRCSITNKVSSNLKNYFSIGEPLKGHLIPGNILPCQGHPIHKTYCMSWSLMGYYFSFRRWSHTLHTFKTLPIFPLFIPYINKWKTIKTRYIALFHQFGKISRRWNMKIFLLLVLALAIEGKYFVPT